MRTNAGIAPIVAVGSHEDMNRRQLLARSAALAAALAADPVVSMSGTVPSAGAASVTVHAAPVGQLEREIVAAIRRVMFGLGSPGPGPEQHDPLDVTALDHRVHTAWRFRQGSHYLELGQMLPELLADAHLASQELTGDQQALAFAFLAHSYNTASSLLRKLGDDGLAMIAADRAVQTARMVNEPLLLAASAYRLANTFLPAGRIVEAKEVALAAAGGLERRLDASLAHLATWGGLILTAAVAAARQGDGGEPGSWWARPRPQPAGLGLTTRTFTPSSGRRAWRSRAFRWRPSSATAERSYDEHGSLSRLAFRRICLSGVHIC